MPSQRMQCVRRAGPSRTWALAKPRWTSPRTASAGTRHPSNRTSQCPPVKPWSIVGMCRVTRTPGLSASTRNMSSSSHGPGPPPWFDCDTDDDLRAAEEWVR